MLELVLMTVAKSQYTVMLLPHSSKMTKCHDECCNAVMKVTMLKYTVMLFHNHVTDEK